MIELGDGIWIAPEHVTLVKEIDDEQCSLFFVGQSALEGHVIPFPAEDVAGLVNQCLGIETDEPEEDDVEEEESDGNED